MATDKRTIKKENYNTDFLNALKDKYGVGLDYIRKSIRGDRNGVIPMRISKDYKSMMAASNEIIQSKIQE